MSCTYLVNGKWLTELEFKEVLNQGLLDSLIESGTLKLKGFPVNKKKVVSAEKSKEVSTRKVDAKVLQNILLQEVRSRQGYPVNMESALELNEKGTDFKIPLWSSPYASKFESILTSIVSNKVVKQKFPGHSYVLGSQEGFSLKEGNEAMEEFKKSSGIVVSKNFDPKLGLQPMRPDLKTGKMLPAQIMIPFKFRDESGKIINVKEFIGEDGLLDFDKIPEKILTLFGFRIPTQEQNSMSSVEIVGFLPEASGDLMLAPRDFTRQMGSDFDVDKMYTYMYNTYYKDGKLHTDFISDQEEIKKQIKEKREQIQELKKEFRFSQKESELFDEYLEKKLEEGRFDENGEEIVESVSQLFAKLIKSADKEIQDKIQSVIDEVSVLNRSYVSAQQNTIIDVHHQILTSTNPEVIKSVFSLDTFGDFENLAKEVYEERKKKGTIPEITTILSDEYQKMKYINAIAGKAGVGNFSLDSTFNAIAQGKNLFLDNRPADLITAATTSPSLELNEPVIIFGTSISLGDLSNKYTLDSQEKMKKGIKTGLKTKSLVIRSLQSSAVDNEKAQILDKLNINNETFDAIRALTLLGFEEKDIAGLLTQDIIWEYVEELRNARSSLKDFNPNIEAEVYTKLFEKYNPTAESITSEKMEILGNISGEEMMNIVKSNNELKPGSDYNLQQILFLDKFLKLQRIGKDLKKVQSAINTESKGVPKSLIETHLKVNQINKLNESNIINAGSLLGEYMGDINPTLEVPTTISGQAAFYGTKVVDKIFADYFPYKEAGFDTLVNEIAFYSSGEDSQDMSATQQAKLRQDIFKEVRSYLFSDPKLGFTFDNLQSERSRLFVDTATNKSLAKILQELSEQKWFMENNFLNKLTFDVNFDGSLSRINFEAATGENFDEKNIYLGFAYLFDKNVSIGKFNDIDYTSRTLAQDLITAAFLEGGNQGSKQYLKYIPTAYLKGLPFGDMLNSTSLEFGETFGGQDWLGEFDKYSASRMSRQYFQNNPSKAKTITSKDIKSTEKYPDKMSLTEDARKANYVTIFENGISKQIQRKYLSIYDKKEVGEAVLYEYDYKEKVYNRIPVLSDKYGFKQYDMTTDTPVSIIQKNSKKATPKESTLSQEDIEEREVEIKVETPRKDLEGKERINDILNKLELNKTVSDYNKELISTLRTLPGLEDINLVIDNDSSSVGIYQTSTNTVTLNYKKMGDLGYTPNKIASTVIHELIHAYSSKIIKQVESGNTEGLTQEQIDVVGRLKNLQDQYIKHLVDTNNSEGLQSFHKAYWTSKYNQGKITKEVLDYRLKNGPLGENTSEIPSGFTAEDLSKYYGAIKLEEFVTMALTDEGFQQHLNSIKNQNDKTLLDKLFDMLVDLLSSSLGITINKDSLLVPAIKESLKLMKTNTVQESVPSVVQGINSSKGRFIKYDTEILYSDEGALAFEGTLEEVEKAWNEYYKNEGEETFNISDLEDEFMTVEELEKFKLLCKK
jgi:hypothetical protein